MTISETELILYVKDQESSTIFYSFVLGMEPCLNVPGMTSFQLSEKLRLGLMPCSGISRIICPVLPDPATRNGIPAMEVYLRVDDPQKYAARTISAGGKLVDELKDRDWGDQAVYLADPDGHVIVFAKALPA